LINLDCAFYKKKIKEACESPSHSDIE